MEEMRQRRESKRDEILKCLSDITAPEFGKVEEIIKFLREEYKIEVPKAIIWGLSREGFIRMVWTLTEKSEERLEAYLNKGPESEKKQRSDRTNYQKKYYKDNRDRLTALRRENYRERKEGEK